jgi:hypothetical protein
MRPWSTHTPDPHTTQQPMAGAASDASATQSAQFMVSPPG